MRFWTKLFGSIKSKKSPADPIEAELRRLAALEAELPANQEQAWKAYAAHYQTLPVPIQKRMEEPL